jgi:hypothetical protein
MGMCALCIWGGATVGACLGFLLAGMFAVSKHADEQEARWLNEHNGNEH